MHCDAILEAVSPEKYVVVKPHRVEQPTRDCKSEESSHGSKQFIESVGDLQGYHKKREREAEDGVGKTFDTGDFLASPGESLFPPIRLWANLLRNTTSIHQLVPLPKLFRAGPNATLAAEVAATEFL
jgi:hypothetical protein